MKSHRKLKLLSLLRRRPQRSEHELSDASSTVSGDWSTNSELPIQSDILTREGLIEHASYLATNQQIEFSRRNTKNLHRRFEENHKILEQIYFLLAEAAKRAEMVTIGGEWLLDNFHVIEQNVREIRKLLPKGYYRSLPRIAQGKFRGFPRVYAISIEILAHTAAVIDTELLYNFVHSYQQQAELSIGELWATPIMLKLALVENIRRLAVTTVASRDSQALANSLIDTIFSDSKFNTSEAVIAFADRINSDPALTEYARLFLLRGLRDQGARATLTLKWYEQWLTDRHLEIEHNSTEGSIEASNQILFANSITSLKTLDSLNWHDWVESVSVVDRILRQDTYATFSKSDFQTRNRYRNRIEQLAKQTKKRESDIARSVLTLTHKFNTQNSNSSPEPQYAKGANVGFYLIGDGKRELDAELNRRLPIRERFQALCTQSFKLFCYLGSILVLTALACSELLSFCLTLQAPFLLALLLALLFALPCSEFMLGLVNWVVTKLVTPFSLPRLDFDLQVPDSARTLVGVHSILRDKESIDRTIDFIEVRFLANNDPNILFGLLADLVPSQTESLAIDQELIQHAKAKLQTLNARYCSPSESRFYLLTRKRLWNSSEQCFLCWERKRGKIVDLNRLILGADKTSMRLQLGDLTTLQSVKFVLTLDSDTSLPRGSASELIAAIAHPLNRAEFDEKTERILNGYAILQPRIGITLESAQRSVFSRLFSCSTGLDPYTLEVSDVYQDLFYEGSYIGKGIYDVAAFERALADRAPENTLLSHDLFEGTFARVALCSHVELLDEYPSRYNVYARRQHRWVRGDWQLLPWILPYVPDQYGTYYPNPLSALSYWKLLDNLRRSLIAPATVLFLVLAWTTLNVSPLLFSALAFSALSFPIIGSLLEALLSPPIAISVSGYLNGVRRDFLRNFSQASLGFIFLAHQCSLMLDAILRTIYRLSISRKKLLDWETHYQSEHAAGSSLRSFTEYMLPAILIALGTTLLVCIFNASLLISSLPVIGLWLLSPLIAALVSKQLAQRSFTLSSKNRRDLHLLSWDTWRYFDDLMSAEVNYLPPDNIQFVPNTRIAYRTSPTNLSLALLSVTSAYDLGFINLVSLVRRHKLCFASLDKLERYGGHFYNWYDIKTLSPLHPRYISTVDNGNFVGHLIALKSSFDELAHATLIGPAHWNHLRASLQLLSVSPVTNSVITNRDLIQLFSSVPTNFIDILNAVNLVQKLIPNFNAASLEFPERSECSTQKDTLIKELSSIVALSSLLAWIDCVPKLSAWIHNLAQSDMSLSARKSVGGIEKILQGKLPTLALLTKLNKRVTELLMQCQTLSESKTDRDWFNQISALVLQSTTQTDLLLYEIRQLVKSSERYIKEIDFTFLFDKKKKLFPIGYNTEDAKPDLSYYDLLASEARLASLVAIAKGEIPQEHWFLLGRSLTNSAGGKTLLSWSATMFEYLMPVLVTKEYPGTLLCEASRSAIRAQISYAKQRGVPWGVSESGYAGVDHEQTYQYRAFGIPGLGLKRGLSEDLVISPYSTMLAMMIEPELSLSNMYELEKYDLRGLYGFYEAIDFTPDRLGQDESFHIIKSFLVHHQGMSLIAVNNLLNRGIMQDRFHRDLRIRASVLLLHERFPNRIAITIPHQAELSFMQRPEALIKTETAEIIDTPHTRVPRTHLLSNGKLSVMLDNAGSGITMLEPNIHLYRWREDALVNNLGLYIFIRDMESGQLWSVGYQPSCVEPDTYQVIFSPDKIEFRRRDFEIGVHAEITISPEDNVEIRRISLRNYSNSARRLEVISYAEVALAPARADAAHPAFSKMFIESEYLQDHDALVLSRRPRSQHEQPLYLLHMLNMRVVWDKTQYESSREAFLGRGRTIANAKALEKNSNGSLGFVGPVLDPIVSLRTRVELAPLASETVSFVSAASRDRKEIEFLAQLYHDNLSINRAFEMAWMRSNIEQRNEHSAALNARVYQRLANALYFQVETLRADADTIRQNRIGQSGLWKFGISGDLPIVLLILSHPDQIKFVLELLQTQEYLRQRKVQFDLVILLEYPDVYMRKFSQEIESLVATRSSARFLNVNAGIFIRNSSDLTTEERVLFKAVARVILNAQNGDLADQLEVLDQYYKPPLKKRTLVNYLLQDQEHINSVLKPVDNAISDTSKLEFFNGYGGFLPNSKGYSIHARQSAMTPLPWVNVISNPDFGFVVSESGCGYTWSQNSRENRLTPWSNDSVSDPAAEVIYIRDANIGNFWSPTPLPVASKNSYKVEHCFGYSTFESEQHSIHSILTISGSMQRSVKFYHLTLTNRSRTVRRLELYLYIDFVLGTLKEVSAPQIITSFHKGAKILSAMNYYNNEFAGRTAFVGSSAEILSYTANRAEFLGRNSNLSNPRILHDAIPLGRINRSVWGGYSKLVELSKTVGAGFESCAVIKVALTLEPDQKESLQFFLGESSSFEEASRSAKEYRNLNFRAQELARVQQYWNDKTQSIQVKTPDPKMNLLLNGWLLYQTLSCRILGRSAFYQSGGAFGFRDQLQDTLAFLPTNPELARAQILLSASRQFIEGDVQHWWHPPTGRGVRTRISDDYLWLPYVVAKYIEASGDYAILDQAVPYISGPALDATQQEAYIIPVIAEQTESLYQHCTRALEYGLKFGEHGLPLMGGGDWNDGMNEVGSKGRGESVWLAWFLHSCLIEFSKLSTYRQDIELSSRYQMAATQLKQAIEEHSWDGAWYKRAFADDGSVLGSAVNEECRIDSIAQSWSVISKAADKTRARMALDSVFEQLIDQKNNLVLLLTPAFNRSSLEPGYIKGYLPGVRENGGQYTHAAVWVVIANALLGLGTRAHKIFDMINPISHSDSQTAIARYKAEPYVTCGDVYSVSPHQGRAGWSWYTGSSGWLYQAGIEHILGLRVRSDHFMIEPCVPASWNNFGFTYKRSDKIFEVLIENPDKVESGVIKIFINNKEIEDQKIPFNIADKHVHVRVVMGQIYLATTGFADNT